MYIKIYFNSKPLFLCDEMTREINRYAHHDDAIFIDEFSAAAVNSMIHEMRREKVHAGIFYHTDLEALRKAFWKKFTRVLAAGGLVRNQSEEILFILRRGKWDLPKGKLDKGESLAECGVREVREETGLAQVSLEKFLVPTYHTYAENGKHILKETHWFSMSGDGDAELLPQAGEQITEIRWVKKNGIAPLLAASYPLIADVLGAAGISSN
jgi:8-oxo-dGTP pyrophosphatase MutT (NUDIX family)